MALHSSECVVIDLETTGFKPEQGHEIIELGALKIAGQQVLDRFHSLFLPERLLDPGAIAVHGITMDTLRSEGRAAQVVLPEFLQFLGDSMMIGHNVEFDLAFLNSHLARLGLPSLQNQTLDTLELARKYLIIPSYSLKSVAQYLRIPQQEAHRALADAETTRQVFLKLMERARVRNT